MTDVSFYDVWLKVNDAERKVNETRVPWDQWRQRAIWERSPHIGHEDGDDREVYMASTTLDGFELRAPLDFSEVEEWCDYPYRRVWASATERVILTYCEGDLDYEIAPDDEAFQRAWWRAHRFYVRIR